MGHRCIFRLGRSAVSYSNYCSRLHKGRELHISSVINNKTGTYDDPSSENTSDQTRASSYHQQFRRSSYERKKANYQEDRNKQTGSNRTKPLVSTPPANHYQRLKVNPSADTSEIKTAYYNLSKQYHPDIVGNHNPNAAEDFRLITESYDILCDSKLRAQYDSSIAASEPIFTAWNPSKSATADQDQIYRMREAGRIFKNRQEEALERERMRNPQKFRAGTFRYDDEEDPKFVLERLERKRMFLQNMQSMNSNRTPDGSHFYRLHLYDTLIRKKEDMIMSEGSSPSRVEGSEYAIIVAVVLLVGTFGAAAYTISGFVFDLNIDMDIADLLDRSFEAKVKDIKDKFKDI